MAEGSATRSFRRQKDITQRLIDGFQKNRNKGLFRNTHEDEDVQFFKDSLGDNLKLSEDEKEELKKQGVDFSNPILASLLGGSIEPSANKQDPRLSNLRDLNQKLVDRQNAERLQRNNLRNLSRVNRERIMKNFQSGANSTIIGGRGTF